MNIEEARKIVADKTRTYFGSTIAELHCAEGYIEGYESRQKEIEKLQETLEVKAWDVKILKEALQTILDEVDNVLDQASEELE